MKWLSHFFIVLVVALAGHIATNTVAAGGDSSKDASIVIAMSNPGEFCARGRPQLALAACESTRRPANHRILLAASCASNQWCCRHDFKTGACIRCCSK